MNKKDRDINDVIRDRNDVSDVIITKEMRSSVI